VTSEGGAVDWRAFVAAILSEKTCYILPSNEEMAVDSRLDRGFIGWHGWRALLPLPQSARLPESSLKVSDSRHSYVTPRLPPSQQSF
jgi:hypothetical protein